MRLSFTVLPRGSRLWRNFTRPLSRASRNFVGRDSSNMSHILKAPSDKKHYREITLRNGLTALLISDMDQSRRASVPFVSAQYSNEITSSDSGSETDGTSDSEVDDRMQIDSNLNIPQESGLLMHLAKDDGKKKKKAAAALCVGVGSFCDPPDIPGFAHFLEHMVFMGSKKYKKENAFDDFIAKHGGESNAWTDAERTVFFFDIHKEYFSKALDMFSQFFISPLFLKSSVDREIHAVDNEFQMLLTSDSDRYHQLLGSLAFHGNPIGCFLCGNIKTLKTAPEEKGIDVYDRLRFFYRRMYSAHYMTLVVQAPETLDMLQDLVYDLFENIPNNKTLPPCLAEYRDPFVPRNFHKLMKVVPTEDCQKLDICWALPPLDTDFKCKPLEYLGALIAHEGLGSIMSCLRKKGLALSLQGGNNNSGFDFNKLWSGFAVSIVLTDAGMERVTEVIRIVFEYIDMLQRQGPQAWFYEELRDIENIKFRFREESDPIDNVEQIAENMQLYPLEHYLTGRYLMLSYDAQLIRQCLSYLTPTQSCLTLWSKDFEKEGECNMVDPWFNTTYTVTEIPADWKKQWQNLSINPALHLPDKNPFIPSKFDLLVVEGAAEYPVQVLDSEFGRMWYKKDKKFKIPKGFIMLHFMTPVVSSSATCTALCDLFISVLEQQLLESLYAATLTGYEFSVEGLSTGLVVHMEGFSQKLPQVFELFVSHVADFKATEELFNAVKTQLKKSYYNEMIKTQEFVKMLRYALTEPKNPPVPDRYRVTDSLTLDMLHDFHHQLMNAVYVEGLVTGNFSPQHAVEVGEFVQKKLCRKPLPANKLPQKRMLKLPTGDLQCRVKGVNRYDTSSCVTSYYQQGPGTIYDICLNELLSARMKEPVFNKLRTELQLGYSVFCQSLITNGILGFGVTVEAHANKFGMTEIRNHIAGFMQDFKKTLNKMSKSQFSELVQSVITAKQVEDTQLGDETNRFWQEILDRYYVFDRQEKEIAILQTITHSDLKAWYQKLLDSSKRHVSFQVEGCKQLPQSNVDVKESPCKRIRMSTDLMLETGNFFKLHCEGEEFIENMDKFRDGLHLYPYTKITS